MNYRIIAIVLTSLALLVSSAQAAKRIKIEALPKIIVKNIQKAFPGAELIKAKYTERKGLRIYQIEADYEGSDGDYELDIKISAKGKIIKVKKDFEPDTDDDDDDDDK